MVRVITTHLVREENRNVLLEKLIFDALRDVEGQQMDFLRMNTEKNFNSLLGGGTERFFVTFNLIRFSEFSRLF